MAIRLPNTRDRSGDREPGQLYQPGGSDGSFYSRGHVPSWAKVYHGVSNRVWNRVAGESAVNQI
jgi:hypothetical protein